MAAIWLKATESFTCGLPDGRQANFFAGRNYKSTTPGVDGREHLFEPLDDEETGHSVSGPAPDRAALPDPEPAPAQPTRRAVPGRKG